MDAYEEQLVAPIRDRLNQLGYHAVIVQDEPSLRGSFDLESKVDKYIEAAWGKRGMAISKTIFIAFAKEDESTRNLFTGQRVNSGTPSSL